MLLKIGGDKSDFSRLQNSKNTPSKKLALLKVIVDARMKTCDTLFSWALQAVHYVGDFLYLQNL